MKRVQELVQEQTKRVLNDLLDDSRGASQRTGGFFVNCTTFVFEFVWQRYDCFNLRIGVLFCLFVRKL